MIRERSFFSEAVLALTLLLVSLAACATRTAAVPGPESAYGQDLRATAAAQATAIIQQAQATALVLQAQAQAAVLVGQADEPPVTPNPSQKEPAKPSPTDTPSLTSTNSPPGASEEKPETHEPTEEQAVMVTGVGFAGEGGFIIIRFKAPPEEAERWWQGSISLIDEKTGTVYDEIPVMPKLGPLIGKPQTYEQIGYVMLVNIPPGLSPGAAVKVTLGDYIFEHIKVE